MKYLVITIIILLANSVFAVDQKARCMGEPWNKPRRLNNIQFERLFNSIEKFILVKTFFKELTVSQDKTFVLALSKYLIGTELNTDRRAFFMLLQYAAELEVPEGRSKALSANEICEIYGRVPGGVK